METSQNLENVQKTNLKNFHTQFDHLSVVPEENSTENSEKNSNRASLPNESWNCGAECDVIKPDQSYPDYEDVHKASTLPAQPPANFFSPITASKSYEGYCNENFPYGEQQEQFPRFPDYQQTAQHFRNYRQNQAENENPEIYMSQKTVNTNAKNFYQNMILVPRKGSGIPDGSSFADTADKTSTDLIVKMDNHNFNNTPSQSTFSNGGNLEELLNDIEAISQDILKISSSQKPYLNQTSAENQNVVAPNSIFGTQNPNFVAECSDIVNKIQNSDLSYVQNSKVDNLELLNNGEEDDEQKPYKSEISVVLMPTPMPLIGFDKYKNLQKSSESIASMSASTQNLRIIPETIEQQNVIIHTPSSFFPGGVTTPQIHEPIQPPIPENKIPLKNLPSDTGQSIEQTNPFFFGNLRDSYSTSSYFNSRYNPDNFCVSDDSKTKTDTEMCNSKSNLLDDKKDATASENEEHLKLKPPKVEEGKIEEIKKTAKSPKLSIRRKVSIHFKGKKDKNPKPKSSDAIDVVKTKTPAEKRHSIFDIKFDKKQPHQKAPSAESKKSETNLEPKTPTSSDSKTSKNSEPKSSSSDVKTPETKIDRTMSLPNYETKMPEGKVAERKTRKSVSVSPDRRHVHMKEDSSKRCHKKHRKGDRSRTRRSSISTERFLRERSFSVCTDRSNILDHRLGFGFGSSYLYDYDSDRERTNSLSSCDTIKTRKMSNISNIPVNGKIPWCGCWGNGCL